MKKYLPLLIIVIVIISVIIINLRNERSNTITESDQLYQGVSDNSLEGYYEMSQQINSGKNQKEPEINMSEALLNKDGGTNNLDNQSSLKVNPSQ